MEYKWDFEGDGVYDFVDSTSSDLVSYTSQYNSTYVSENIIDGEIARYNQWLSQNHSSSPLPQEFIFDLPGDTAVNIDMAVINPTVYNGLAYQAKDIEILASSTTSDVTQFSVIDSITLAQNTNEQVFTFTSASAKYVMLRINTNYGATQTGMAEFRVMNSTDMDNLLSIDGDIIHIYTEPDVYQPTAQVKDNDDKTASASTNITIDPASADKNVIWLVETQNDYLMKLNFNLEILAKIDGFNDPRSLSINPTDGTIWVIDYNNNRIVKLTGDVPDGYDISSSSGSHSIYTGFSYPADLKVDPSDGSCWVSNTNNHELINISDSAPDNYDISVDTGFHISVTGITSPKGLDIDPSNGDCYVAGQYSYYDMRLFWISGSVPNGYDISSGTLYHRYAKGFGQAEYVSFSSSDNSLWVSDINDKSVIHIQSDFPNEYDLTQNSDKHVRIGGFTYPQRLFANPVTNQITVADSNGNKIFKIDGSDNRHIFGVSHGTFSPKSVAVNTKDGIFFYGSGTYTEGFFRCSQGGNIISRNNSIKSVYDLEIIPGTLAGGKKSTDPVVSASVSAVTGDVPLSVDFTVTASDSDGTIVSYEWDFEGDGIYDWSSTTTGNTSHTYTTAAIYVPVIRVIDNSGDDAYDYHLVIRSGVITCEASADPTTANVNNTIYFQGSAYSPNGSISLYEWDFDGDTVFDYSQDTPIQTSHSYNTTGEQTVILRVTDSEGEQALDSVKVFINSSPPRATAYAYPNSGNIPLVVQLTGSSSSDPDGSIVLYEWDYDGNGVYDFASETESDVGYVYTATGTYYPVIRVTDNDGSTNTDSATVTVNPPSLTVTANASPLKGNTPLLVSFNGDGKSYGGISKYEWDFESDGVYDYVSDVTASTTYTYTTTGYHSATLRLTDIYGQKNTDSILIRVNPAGSPVAIAEADPEQGPVVLEVDLKGDQSYDSDGSITEYEWNYNAVSGYITDSYNKKIYKLKLDGSIQKSVYLNDYYGLSGIVVDDSDGSIWVADSNSSSSKITKFDSYLNITKKYYGFYTALDLSIDSDNKICWVADWYGDKIYSISMNAPNNYNVSSGTGYHHVFSKIDYPISLSVDTSDGSCWVVGYHSNDVIKIASDGYTQLKRVTGFNYPRSISINQSDGTVWIANETDREVVRLSSTITDGYNINSDTGQHVIYSDIGIPYSVSVDPTDGGCWAADSTQNEVVKLDSSGTTRSATVTGIINPTVIKVDAYTGNCMLISNFNTDIVYLNTDKGEELFRVGGFESLKSIAIAPRLDISSSTVSNITAVYSKSGAYNVELKVTDNSGLSDSDLITVTATRWRITCCSSSGLSH